ncbi:PfkB family carbohydrate kinase [Paeniglutamicibacter sp. MACA_103]|uniref:PfkB family carbohydrate kinase n=1 Tax=Paeniglutamicibacter sp. MACA_103 TaxID=3377337 RepID=UPI003893C5B9
MKKKTIGVIGSINVDLLLNVKDLPGPGHTVHGQGGTMSPGGKGANQALAAARQGAGVLLIGAVGNDPHAEIALSLLADAKVDLAHVKHIEEATGLAVVTVDQYGENNIVVIAGANSTVSREAVDSALPMLRRCSLVVLQGEIPVATVDHAIEMLTKSGTRIVLNLAPVIGIRPESIRKADPLIVNEHEAVQALELLGIGPPHPTFRLGKYR